jgi:hypothetical protein
MVNSLKVVIRTWYWRFIFFISICRSHSVCILSIERSSKHSG